MAKRKMRFKIYLTIKMLLLAVLPLCLLSGTFFLWVNPAVSNLSTEYLQNIVEVAERSYDDYFSDKIRFLQSVRDGQDLTELVEKNKTGSQSRELIQTCCNHLDALFLTSTSFLSVYIVDSSGKILAQNRRYGEYDDVSQGSEVICAEPLDTLFPLDSFQNKPVISSIAIYPNETETRYFSIVAPWYGNGSYDGFLIFNISCGQFQKLTESIRFFSKGYMSFFDSKGGQVFGGYPSITSLNANNENQLKNFAEKFYSIDFKNTPQGTINYLIGKERKRAYYAVCPESGWVLFASVSELGSLNYKQFVYILTAILVFGTVLFALLSTFFILRWIMARFRGLSGELQKIKTGDYSIRIDTSEDMLVCQAASQFNSLMDSFEARKDELERRTFDLDQSNERYQIITDYTREIIFEWNFEKDEADYSFTWWKKFGYDPVMRNVRHDIYIADNIHPDDVAVFQSWVERIWMGTQNSKEEFRIRTIDGNYFWVRVRTVPIFGKDSKPVKLVGLIQDIDDSKKKEDELIQRADYDLLSQLYNRSAFEERVNSLILKKHRFALMYIDIDDFRRYNTKFGHEFGDRVIQFIGNKILKTVGKNGFAGRVGGDEFIICISSPSMMPFIDVAAEQVGDELKSGLRVRESDVPVEVKCSIGIVFYPDHAESYEALSVRADKAMYNVKHSGKNSYAIASDNDKQPPEIRAIQTAPTEE